MLFDTERARYLSEEVELQVSAEYVQRAMRAARSSRTAAVEQLIEHGLYLADSLVRHIEQWAQNVTRSMRWLLVTHNQ